MILALASLTYAIIEAPQAGWTSAGTLGLFAFSLVCFATLVFYELRRASRCSRCASSAASRSPAPARSRCCAFAAQGGFLFLNTLYLQGVRHLSPFHAGLYMLPMAGMVLVFAPVSGRLVSRHGARPSLVSAGAALMIASVHADRLTPTTSSGYLLGAYFLFGLGAGLINPPITNTAVSGMPPSQAGVAAAIASTSRQVGMTLGVAVLGAISGGTISGAIGPSFAAATHAGWWICAGLGLACLVLGVLTTTGGRRAPPGRRPSGSRERAASRPPAPAARYGRASWHQLARLGRSLIETVDLRRPDRDDARNARGAPSEMVLHARRRFHMPPISHQTIKLTRGRHSSPEHGACVMELASMLAGESFSDHPRSVSRPIASFLRGYNDLVDDRRRADLYRYASQTVGTAGSAEIEQARARRLLDWGDSPGASRAARSPLERMRSAAPTRTARATPSRPAHTPCTRSARSPTRRTPRRWRSSTR